jgi:hemolysin activation/secretion protein
MLRSLSSARPPGLFGLTLLMALWAMPVAGQAPPDAGRLLQETRPPPSPERQALPLPPLQAPATPRSSPPASGGDTRVQVTHFDFSGNSALSTEVLGTAVAPWAGRSLTFGDLIQAVEAIEARYKEAGFFLAQAYLPPQKIRDGAIEIAISEGRLGETRLEGESRVSSDVLYRYLDRLPKDQALVLATVERQVLLINELAGIRTSLDLQAGENPGSTDIVLAQQTDELISGRLDANNHGAPSTGVRRYGLTLNAGSPFNQGERISANLLSSEDRNLISYSLRGELPVGGDGWRLIATASRAEYSLGGAFANLEASGTADSIRLGAAYPLLRSRATNVRIQLEADQSKLIDSFRASNLQLDKKSRGLTAALSGDTLDEFMGGGSSRADLSLRRGTLSLGPTAASLDAPPTGLGTEGSFTKASLILQRVQTLTRDLGLLLQLTQQWSGKNLDSSEKLSLGGATSIPGYVSGEGSGDSGTHLKLAVRWQALPELALTAFADHATLHLAHDPLAAATTNTKTLSDTGFIADWQFDKHLSVNAILAWAGKEAPNPADNDKPRFWVSLGYAW